MQVRKLAVSGAVALGSVIALGVATPAYALCESYSGGCPSTPPGGGIGGNEEQPGTGNENPGTDEPVVDEPTGDKPVVDKPVKGDTVLPADVATPTDSPATLPFTGGELVLLSTIGVGALVGGTALVVAGRRRSESA